MTTNTMSPASQVPDARPALSHSVPPGPIDRPSGTDHILKARYGVWIQSLVNHSIGIEKGVYLSTFQIGRGQHITALDSGQARALGNRLIALADEAEVGGTGRGR